MTNGVFLFSVPITRSNARKLAEYAAIHTAGDAAAMIAAIVDWFLNPQRDDSVAREMRRGHKPSGGPK